MRRLCLLLILLCSLGGKAQDSPRSDALDDVLRLAPYSAVVVMKGVGVESRSSWGTLAVSNAAGAALAVTVSCCLKAAVHERRPDGSGDDAFPSGHTVIAFAGAAALDKEYRALSPWISAAGYALAATVAADRVAQRRHRWSDVMAGAAIGVVSTELGYLIGSVIMKKKTAGSENLAVKNY